MVYCQPKQTIRLGYSRLDAFHAGYTFKFNKDSRWNASIMGGYNFNIKNFNTGILGIAVFKEPYSRCIPELFKPEFVLRGLYTNHPAMRFWILSPGVDFKLPIFTNSMGHLDAFAGGAMNAVLAFKRKSFKEFIWPRTFIANVGLRYELEF